MSKSQYHEMSIDDLETSNYMRDSRWRAITVIVTLIVLLIGCSGIIWLAVTLFIYFGGVIP